MYLYLVLHSYSVYGLYSIYYSEINVIYKAGEIKP